MPAAGLRTPATSSKSSSWADPPTTQGARSGKGRIADCPTDDISYSYGFVALNNTYPRPELLIERWVDLYDGVEPENEAFPLEPRIMRSSEGVSRVQNG